MSLVTTKTAPLVLTSENGAGPRVLERAPDGRVILDASNGDLRDLLDLTRVVLADWNLPPQVFVFADLVQQIATGPRGDRRFKSVSEAACRTILATSARWMRTTERGEAVDVLPPLHAVRAILAELDPPFPRVERLLSAPAFVADGRLLRTPGYDAEARVYLDLPQGLVIPPLPEQPTAADLAQARRLILDELLGEFPFVSAADKAQALALLLLPFVRDLIAGPTPLHLAKAPAPGTGKGLLVECALMPGCGDVATMTEGRDEDGWRKRLMAALTSGSAAVIIDNLREVLDSAALSSVLTATISTDRRLGFNDQTLTVPVRTIWAATGNNPRLSEEMVRRTVPTGLDAKVENPWERTFRNPRLKAWTRENRGRLIAAACTLVQAWIVAGRPRGSKTIGTYEAWAETLGGIIDVAGVPGFLDNLRDFYAEADVDGRPIRALITAWQAERPGQDLTIQDLLLFLEMWKIDVDLGSGNDRSRQSLLGRRLASQEGKVIASSKLVKRMVEGRTRWRLEPVTAPSAPADGGGLRGMASPPKSTARTPATLLEQP